ncbi:MFS transporter [Litorivita pollutaquae]|uniref:MFS transporter n=1 Tax=Litorivita pollutaquae TaxID=2200892 RepID=A0A2V4NGL3_9RHOB|nr:MFS transporter [Litorivita pollutaquae]PYC49230.1 MFS transporter [Litorivita pollutaquae]
MPDTLQIATFERITGKPQKTPDAGEARNGLRHVAALAMTKLSDGLIDPKLVLSWLLTTLGAPALYAGALVPIREAGALLPQLFLADRLERMALRKRMWVAGSVIQGLAALMIALAGMTLTGAAAGLAICAALAVLALARAASSVAYKEVLGKTVAQSRRGAVTGMAGSLASALIFVFAVLMILGALQGRAAIIAAVALAGGLWLSAALTFWRIEEAPSQSSAPQGLRFWSVLGESAPLRRYIMVRGLLVSTALAPPYLVVLAQQAGAAGLSRLGVMVLASAAAAFLSSYVWGRLADRSARWVLMLSGVAGGAALVAALGLDLVGLAGEALLMPLALFALMIAYHGVRQGRSVYLVDMAPEGKRGRYGAVANTAIGTILLGAGAIGGGVSLIGTQAVVAVFAVMAFAGGALALTLDEVGRAE